MVRAAPDMAGCPAVQMPPPTPRQRRRQHAALAAGLTGFGRRQNVARLVR
jgi:hypothetical protein